MKMKIAVTLGVVLAVTVLFTACMTEAAEERITVTFDSQGGTEVASVELIRGGTLGARYVTPTRDDDEFLGWFSNFDRFTADTVINVSLELSARWRSYDFVDTIPVTFYAPGALPPVTIVNVAIGNALGPIFPVDPRLRGYWFGGWEVNGVSFTNMSIVTEPITATATWAQRDAFRVVLWVPETHRMVNDGVSQRYFTVYDGEAIIDVPDWENYFPVMLNTAPDPDVHQFHEFFRWGAGAGVNGLIVDQYTIMTSDIAGIINTSGPTVQGVPQPLVSEVPLGAERDELGIDDDAILLGGFFGLFFHPVYFDVDLSTFDIRRPYAPPPGFPPGQPVFPPRNMVNNAPNQNFNPGTGTFSVTVDRFNSQFWFLTPGVQLQDAIGALPPEPGSLRDLLNRADVVNETQFRFEVTYRYVGDFCECPEFAVEWRCEICGHTEVGGQHAPVCATCGDDADWWRACGRRRHPNNPDNAFNIMIANIRGTDNWNAVMVYDLTLSEITYGVFSEITGEYEPAIHSLAPTHASNAGGGSGGAGWNRNWVYFRAGRRSCVNAEGPFDLEISRIRIHLVQ